MPEATAYNDAFYDLQADGSALSASVMLEVLFSRYIPASVVDIGCGVGTWLRAYKNLGVGTGIGLDGDYVERSKLRIPEDDFRPTDITDPEAVARSTSGRRFELAISLEVAEHLDRSHAETFIRTLTSLSDVVLFSAAIPYQGGTSHVNECWPEFWAILFRAAGYDVVDLFRPRLWGDRRVAFWYRQNAMLFVRAGSEAASKFVDDRELCFPLSVVHPEMLAWASTRLGRAPDGNLDRDKAIHSALHTSYREGAKSPPAAEHAYGSEFDYRYGGLKEHLPTPVKRAAKAVLSLVKR